MLTSLMLRMNPEMEIGTDKKALQINLNANKYGTFAEIGAGQEVARRFFHMGAAAGTIAKTMSAYDMTSATQFTVPRIVTSAASASKQCSTMSTIFWWNGLTKGLERKEHFSFSQIQSRRAVLNGTMNHTAGWACDFSLKNAATQARLLSTCGCLMKQTLTNKKRLGSLA